VGEIVGRFTELKKLPYGPPSQFSEFQDAKRHQFAEELANSSFQTENRPNPDRSTVYLLIGAATWNNYDMILLDRIEPEIGKIDANNLSVAVFDIDICKTESDIDQIIPGLGSVPQTPAVGLWVDGKLVETASGFLGRQLVERIVSAELQLQPYRDSMAALASKPLAAV
jgi:hypothetical protein